MIEIPHFSFPFRFASPAAVVVEQDSIDEIADAALVVLLCPLGFRVELPEFGLPDPTFSTPGVDTDVIRSAIDLWEPRALTAFAEVPDAYDELAARVQTLVQVRTEE